MSTNKRAYAYIVRCVDDCNKLLVFREKGKGDYKPFHIPGGGVDPGETPEEAVVREIEEESGLTGFQPTRLIGQWIEQHPSQIFQRYFFLFYTTSDLPDQWTHTVTGEGLDAGIQYNFSWIAAEEALKVHMVYHAFLNSRHLSDLFSQVTGLGLGNDRLYLLPYVDNWPTAYEEESKLIRTKLGKHLADMQHIGSTSVPGMIAKPIIDLALTYPTSADLAQMIEGLEELGYENHGANGIPGRHFFKKRDRRQLTVFHLHMFPDRHPHFQRHLDFRDALRTDDVLADEYYLLKLKSWQKYVGDRQNYTRAKGPFFTHFFRKRETVKLAFQVPDAAELPGS